MVVSVNPQGISPQVCSGNVTLTVPGSTSAPLVIPVSLHVSDTSLLSVSQPAINVTALAGAAATVQMVSVTSTDSTVLSFNATASTNPVGLPWLAVTPNTGNTPNNLQVTVSPASLGVGVYTGSITVSSTAQNVPAQTIPVTLTVVGSTAAASPTTLTFTQAVGAAAPASQTVQIGGVPTGSTIGAVATLLSGDGLAYCHSFRHYGYRGLPMDRSSHRELTRVWVTVIVPGAAASPLYVPVTLDVTVATSAITLSASTLSFDVLAGSMSVPTAQTVQVASATAGTSVPFSTSFVPGTGGNFVTINPTSSNTPGTITVGVNAAVSSMLAAGTYIGNLQVASGTSARFRP